MTAAGKEHGAARAEALVASYDGILLAALLKPAPARRDVPGPLARAARHRRSPATDRAVTNAAPAGTRTRSTVAPAAAPTP